MKCGLGLLAPKSCLNVFPDQTGFFRLFASQTLVNVTTCLKSLVIMGNSQDFFLLSRFHLHLPDIIGFRNSLEIEGGLHLMMLKRAKHGK